MSRDRDDQGFPPRRTARRLNLAASQKRPADQTRAGPSSAPVAPAIPEAAPRSSTDLTAKRVELILQQLESLPTLSAVAVRLLQMTADDESSGSDVVKIVACDPALSAKVLKLCRCSERGRVANVTTVERAVLLLGIDALRSAILSVQVFDLFDGMESPGGEIRDTPVFDRVAFWRHSLAVACLCESLAGTEGLCRSVSKADAFVSGLIHDLGMVALHVLLPRTFDRVCDLAQTQAVSLDQACRKIIGLDTHTVGRRLAEHWRLPHSLGDVLWLHGQRMESMPDLAHRPQIALVTLADALARRHYLAPPGHAPRGEDESDMARQLGLRSQLISQVVAELPRNVEARAVSAGIENEPEPQTLLRALGRANNTLGRLNAAMRQQTLQAQRQSDILRTITQFHDSASPGGSVVSVMGKVVESAANIFGGGFYAVLYQARMGEHWQLIQFATDGRPVRSELIVPPPDSTAVADLADDTQVSMQVMAMLPWLCEYLGDARDLRKVQLLPLRCGWGVNAVLLHDCEVDGRYARQQLEALGRTWAAAVAAGAQHEGAKRLGEQLAEANRALLETQDELARSKALAALGEVAAGAAHEMNNPLTVISGRSQLLASTLREAAKSSVANPHTTDRGDSQHEKLDFAQLSVMAEQISEQSHRISDMITALRTFAEPTKPNFQVVNFFELLNRVVNQVRAQYAAGGGAGAGRAKIKVLMDQTLETIWIDPDQISRAVAELLRNALESEGSSQIELRVQIEPPDDRLKVQVTDDGSGLTAHALAHAFDPFFSAKPAGRQPGLGLAQARRWVEAHGGQLTLENGKEHGAVATIRLDHWRGPMQQQRRNVA